MMMTSDRCDGCEMTRPRWHGGPHECLVVGEWYRLNPKTVKITEEELAFLRR